jgi:hypothetical protein
VAIPGVAVRQSSPRREYSLRSGRHSIDRESSEQEGKSRGRRRRSRCSGRSMSGKHRNVSEWRLAVGVPSRPVRRRRRRRRQRKARVCRSPVVLTSRDAPLLPRSGVCDGGSDIERKARVCRSSAVLTSRDAPLLPRSGVCDGGSDIPLGTDYAARVKLATRSLSRVEACTVTTWLGKMTKIHSTCELTWVRLLRVSGPTRLTGCRRAVFGCLHRLQSQTLQMQVPSSCLHPQKHQKRPFLQSQARLMQLFLPLIMY